MHFWHLQPVSMHFYYAFLAIDFAFGIHGLVPGQQLIIVAIVMFGKQPTLRRGDSHFRISMCVHLHVSHAVVHMTQHKSSSVQKDEFWGAFGSRKVRKNSQTITALNTFCKQKGLVCLSRNHIAVIFSVCQQCCMDSKSLEFCGRYEYTVSLFHWCLKHFCYFPFARVCSWLMFWTYKTHDNTIV